jgi:hypothetical protein
MSKRNRQKRQKATAIDIQTRIHQMLRADFQCSEEEIYIIDQALKGMASQELVDKMTQWAGQPIEPMPERSLYITDDDTGEVVQKLTMTNHPVGRLYDYLLEKYPEKFATLYWAALTSAEEPAKFYGFMRLMKKDPSLMDNEIDGNEAES